LARPGEIGSGNESIMTSPDDDGVKRSAH
jgi:hypothetical protein